MTSCCACFFNLRTYSHVMFSYTWKRGSSTILVFTMNTWKNFLIPTVNNLWLHLLYMEIIGRTDFTKSDPNIVIGLWTGFGLVVIFLWCIFHSDTEHRLKFVVIPCAQVSIREVWSRDHLQSFFLLHSLGEGTGSGVGTYLARELTVRGRCRSSVSNVYGALEQRSVQGGRASWKSRVIVFVCRPTVTVCQPTVVWCIQVALCGTPLALTSLAVVPSQQPWYAYDKELFFLMCDIDLRFLSFIIHNN